MARRTKYSETEFGPFVLDDRTGSVYVDPSDADVVLTSGDEFEVEGGTHPPEFVAEYVEQQTPASPVGNRKRWYQEYRIDVDGEVRVAGGTNPDEVPALDGPLHTAVVDAGGAPKFVVTDDHDLGLGRRMVQEAFGNLLIAGILLVFAYVLLFV